jgi:excisionase family DNA binding protein
MMSRRPTTTEQRPPAGAELNNGPRPGRGPTDLAAGRNGHAAPPADSPAPAERLLLTPRDAAALLSISERTLWGLTDSGAVRAVRIGRAVRYAVEDLREYVRRLREEARG